MTMVCIYADTTQGLFTEEECELDNLVYVWFPSEIVRAFYEEMVDHNGTFEEWYNEEYTADDTCELYDYAKRNGFYASRDGSQSMLRRY